MSGLGHLSKFPPEILEQILDGLCVHHVHDLKDHLGESQHPYNSLIDKQEAETANLTGLTSLCRASKHLNQLATWRLYHSLIGLKTRSNWLLIARTLIEREDLAAHVRHLFLDDNLHMPEDPSHFPPEVVAYFAQNVALDPDGKLTADSLTHEDPDDDIWGTTQHDAAVALMTSLCPNLSTLCFVVFKHVSAFALSPWGSVPSLREVQVSYCDTEGGYDLGLLAGPFEVAPGITRLRLLQVNCSEPLDEGLELGDLTHLDLQDCCIAGHELANMLRLCPNLRELKYYCGGAVYGDEQFSPQEAVAAILEHVPALQRLELDLLLGMDFDDFTTDDLREAKRALERRGIECKFAGC